MSEEQAEYKTEVDEALEMLGKGYNEPIPPTEFISTMSGFTPAPDVLIQEYGYVTALAWGRVWRYCQMADGVCRASLEKIAAGLGMSERTIIRHLDELCGGGYLFDTTPDLKNKPHVYADTGKIRIRFNVEAGVTESQRAMTESQRQGDRESVEESIKKAIKKNGDAVDFEIHYHLKPKAIRDAFAKYFKLTPNWDAKYNRQCMEWLLQMDATAEQVEHAADLWRKDTRFNWQVPTLKGVQEHWLELIADMSQEEEERPARVPKPILPRLPRPANVPPPVIGGRRHD